MNLLVLCPDYPNKDNISFQFVHQRLKEYKKMFKNLNIDVFCYDLETVKNEEYTFDGIHVYKNEKEKVYELFKSKKYDKILIHYPYYWMLEFIKDVSFKKEIIVWLHGSDCLKWTRRLITMNATIGDVFKPIRILKLLRYIRKSQRRVEFAKQVINYSSNLKVVVVSEWLKRAIEKDVKQKCDNILVIHNNIDFEEFKFVKKKPNMRFKVLSVTPYKTLMYGTDILMKMIKRLSKEPFFNSFEFNIYGMGPLFKKHTDSLKKYSNVKVNNKFINHEDLNKAFKKHGIFLCPKRADTQGVTRCEAMAAGLVAVGSNVEATREFTPLETGYTVSNVREVVKVFKELYENEKLFLETAEKGANFIREKCSYENTLKKELELILGRKL